MGLDFSIGEHEPDGVITARWSYSGFHSFRERIWYSCGFEGELEEYYKNKGDKIETDHPLFHFFNHSDCDGELEPEKLKVIVPMLEAILDLWDSRSWDTKQGKILVENMKLCIDKDVPLIFC